MPKNRPFTFVEGGLFLFLRKFDDLYNQRQYVFTSTGITSLPRGKLTSTLSEKFGNTFKLWVDTETGVLLKLLTFDAQQMKQVDLKFSLIEKA